MSVRFNRRTVSFTEEVWNHLTSDILHSKVRVQEAPTDPLNLGSPIPPIWGSISPFFHVFDDAPQPGVCIAMRALASVRHWRERRRKGLRCGRRRNRRILDSEYRAITGVGAWLRDGRLSDPVLYIKGTTTTMTRTTSQLADGIRKERVL